ncbi:Fic family protein [Cyclonatronum sp.]|uniref:Fic family protein n=1 Tax=Cyclonatronum sp. TaxID=3024185 RepID=UPI0025C600B1|nr:RNA-binding domain-containing protein [Cyclonatronum sp.]
MKESNRIELKRTLTDSLEKEVVAFLNYREGGIIYIGINDDGSIAGIDNPDAMQLTIKDRLKSNIQPVSLGLFDIIQEERDGKWVLKIIVASGPEKPYYLKKSGMSEKGCFIRIGSASEPMPSRMIENLFASRIRNSIGQIESNRQSLKFEQLRIYYEESGKKLNAKFAGNLGLLTKDGRYNYAGFLLSDSNSLSVKVAKYMGTSRTHLLENNEYGYCCLIKATKQVLDKIELENATRSRITSTTRIDTRLWNPVAIREAVINAIVHNDYTREIPPKFEIFDDRIEITSAGSLPEALNQNEFFEGFSIPRNQEIMRIFKDLELVEHLGSGIPRILEKYSKKCFRFTENFLRMTFPNAWLLGEEEDTIVGVESTIERVAPHVSPQVTPQATPQVKALIMVLDGEKTRSEIQKQLRLSDRKSFRTLYINEALKHRFIEMSIPDKPQSPLQKYKLTEIGKAFREQLRYSNGIFLTEAPPQATPQATPHVNALILVLQGEKTRAELQELLKLTDKKNFRTSYLNEALRLGLIELVMPDKPQSSSQRYRLTKKGKLFQQGLRELEARDND